MPFAKDKLSLWRRTKGFSQTQAAEKIGVTQVYYSQLENGKRTPSLGVLENIAEATCLNLSDLMQTANPTPPPPTRGKRTAKGARARKEAVSE